MPVIKKVSKKELEKLIENSSAIQDLPAKEKRRIIADIWELDESKQQKLAKLLQKEQEGYEKIEEETENKIQEAYRNHLQHLKSFGQRMSIFVQRDDAQMDLLNKLKET